MCQDREAAGALSGGSVASSTARFVRPLPLILATGAASSATKEHAKNVVEKRIVRFIGVITREMAKSCNNIFWATQRGR